MPRIHFTVVLSGVAWFSLASLLFFIYHEKSLLNDARQAIVADFSTADKHGKPAGDLGGKHAHHHHDQSRSDNLKGGFKPKKRSVAGADEELDPILGQLDKEIPRFGPGEGGQPVLLSGEALERAKSTHSLHNFNLVVSDKISVERSVKDTRDPRCQDITYKFSNLPSASIVIAFHNEAWSTLMRTVHSIRNRTPQNLLKEIILVDDASDDPELSRKLKNLPVLVRSKVRVIHTKQSEGVAKAKMAGAREAQGDVLVFLDSHCEVNTHWLEPMLDLILQGPTTVVSPIIDKIDPETFAYDAGPLARNTFKWSLEPRLLPLTKIEIAERRNKLEPVRSPLTSGGIFAVAKSFFTKIGGLDEVRLTAWGGESLEFSFRSWMCGGTIHVIPCSRVGHVMRLAPPYTSLGSLESSNQQNIVRIAEIWMDNYKEEFYEVVPQAKDRFYGDISDAIDTKNRLGCHNFDWYLNHVVPALLATARGVRLAWGQIHNHKSDLCLAAPKGGEGKYMVVEKCDRNSERQMMLMTKDYEIRFEELCIDLSDYRIGQHATLEECHGMGGTQEWIHSKPGQIRHRESSYCLDITSGMVYRPQLLSNLCSERDTQKWEFAHYTERANH